jgi:hypothetical protein
MLPSLLLPLAAGRYFNPYGFRAQLKERILLPVAASKMLMSLAKPRAAASRRSLPLLLLLLPLKHTPAQPPSPHSSLDLTCT